MISIFDLAALLLTLSALFSWLNRRFLPLPHAIGLLILGLLASLVLVAVDLAFPQRHLYDALTTALQQIDFTEVVMNGMLAFLLFAGALNLNLQALRERAWPVATLALVGTAVSTAVVGLAVWGVSQALGHALPLVWALVFGALISPTDPVAVLATLKNVQVPQALEVEMQGEALFNDGVGVVLFTAFLGFAAATGGGERGALGIVELLLVEAGGGILLGLVTGYIAYRSMRAIDDFSVEVLITLALVTGTYALAQKLGTSGPLAVVAAGLLVGERGPRDAMSKRTQGYVSALWTLIDEVLNSVLFLLIGLEVLVLRFDASALWLAAAAVPLVILGRGVAVSVSLLLLRWSDDSLSARNVPFLTWAGVRGGISVALALTVPEGEHKPALLAATYAVVLFSIIVQGLTLGIVARRTVNGAKGSHNTPAPL
ncbi:sodium/hydrogen exchanger [Methylorubrum populi]|uniref:Sodium/hydrogen exchanger n=1 Tax=Methylorubrum populi TaxID=223967 RepID=A0A161JL86_9HYPH|nr:sodium:proton antiporter [Methylorubrum populi]BAU88935.1 sodium/hydrogen exchanger [Methylorubrum populi]